MFADQLSVQPNLGEVIHTLEAKRCMFFSLLGQLKLQLVPPRMFVEISQFPAKVRSLGVYQLQVSQTINRLPLGKSRTDSPWIPVPSVESQFLAQVMNILRHRPSSGEIQYLRSSFRYLVVLPLTPRPEGTLKEPQYKSYRVEPAPVGLHLHCWGGSLNGGYGWWYNGHRGAVLIASNQIPYDWWTGYHASRGTCKTFGDGVVQPYTMNRMFGFLDWATRQHREAPAGVREFWPELDLAPRYPSIYEGIPAVLDGYVRYRWRHPIADRRS